MTVLNGVTVYDGIMALVVFFTMVHGYWKGATWQIAPILSLVLGYMIAMPMSVTMAPYFGEPPQNRLFALVAVYLGVSLIVYLMVRSFRAGLDKAKLTEFDRHIGALLGLLKGVLLTLSLTVILLIYSPPAREIILKSESSTIAAKIINAVYPILPQAMSQILRPYLKQIGDDLPLNIQNTDYDNRVNHEILPNHGTTLTPTNSARRSTNGGYQMSTQQTRPLIEEDDEEELPPARPPRRATIQSQPDDSQYDNRYQYDNRQYDARDLRDNRQYDSATRNRRTEAVEERRTTPTPTRSALVPTQTRTDDEEDDPFHPSGSSRTVRQR